MLLGVVHEDVTELETRELEGGLVVGALAAAEAVVLGTPLAADDVPPCMAQTITTVTASTTTAAANDASHTRALRFGHTGFMELS